MIRIVFLSLLFVYAQAGKYWDQSGPGWIWAAADLSYGHYTGPMKPNGYGTKGSEQDDGYVLTFDPPLPNCEPFDTYYGSMDCTYAQNTNYTITLHHESGDTFGGFAVVPSGQDGYGSNFSDPSAGAQVYGFGDQSTCCSSYGIGHTDGSVARTSVSAKWTSPAAPSVFAIHKTVKDSTALSGGKWYGSFINLRYDYRACYDSGDYSCEAPAVFDGTGSCSKIFECTDGDFGNATTNCCKEPSVAPSPDSSSSGSETGGGTEPTEPSAEPTAVPDESSSSTLALSAAAIVISSVFALRLA